MAVRRAILAKKTRTTVLPPSLETQRSHTVLKRQSQARQENRPDFLSQHLGLCLSTPQNTTALWWRMGSPVGHAFPGTTVFTPLFIHSFLVFEVFACFSVWVLLRSGLNANSQSSFINLPSAWITDMRHHTQFWPAFSSYKANFQNLHVSDKYIFFNWKRAWNGRAIYWKHSVFYYHIVIVYIALGFSLYKYIYILPVPQFPIFSFLPLLPLVPSFFL